MDGRGRWFARAPLHSCFLVKKPMMPNPITMTEFNTIARKPT